MDEELCFIQEEILPDLCTCFVAIPRISFFFPLCWEVSGNNPLISISATVLAIDDYTFAIKSIGIEIYPNRTTLLQCSIETREVCVRWLLTQFGLPRYPSAFLLRAASSPTLLLLQTVAAAAAAAAASSSFAAALLLHHATAAAAAAASCCFFSPSRPTLAHASSCLHLIVCRVVPSMYTLSFASSVIRGCH